MSSKKETISLETEPIFSIHIDFADGSNPVMYYNLSLARVMDTLKEWCENWILFPAKDCKLTDSVWYWHARSRGKSLIDLFKELKEADSEPDEEDEEIEPLLEDSLDMEE